MKLKKLNIMLLASVALAMSGCKTNDELDKHHFDNKLFVDVETPVTNLVFEPSRRKIPLRRVSPRRLPRCLCITLPMGRMP